MNKEEIIAGVKYCCSGGSDCGDCPFCDKNCTDIFAKFIIDNFDKENEPAPSANGTSSKSENKNILQFNNSTESIICQALKLAKIAAETGAKITYSDGIFVIEPKARGDNNVIFD